VPFGSSVTERISPEARKVIFSSLCSFYLVYCTITRCKEA